MNILKSTFAAFVAVAMICASTAFAENFGDSPSDYRASAEDYLSSRLTNPRGAKFRFSGEPYRIYADLSGYEQLPAWGVDVRVKSRLPSGGWSGYMSYTVIFVGGDAIAIDEDARRLTRL